MADYDDGIIAITGHRDYPDRAALYRGLDGMNARQYYFGGARGIDTDALEYISRTQPGSVRTVVVPNRLSDQPLTAQGIIKRYSTNVIELKNTGPDRYMIRNRYMVNHSNKTNAFYDFRGRGGTFNTIEYAREKGKLGVVTNMRKYDVNEYRNMSKVKFHGMLKEMKRLKLNLSAIKMLILKIIIEVFKMTVQAFFKGLGYVGVKTIEQFWQR